MKDTRRNPKVKHEEHTFFDGNSATFTRTVVAIPIAVAIVYSQRMFAELDRDTESDYFISTTYRDNIFSSWYAASNLVVFIMLNVWGFWFVNWVTFKSDYPFRSN